jgi:hypothetical protein
LFDNDGVGLPWYIYAGGIALIAFIAKTIGGIASSTITEMEKEEGQQESPK